MIIIIIIILILATIGFFVYNFLFKPKDEIIIITTDLPRIFNSVKPISKESNKIETTKKNIKTFFNIDEENISLLGNLRQNKIITNSEGEEIKVPKRFAFKSFSKIKNIENKPQEGERVGWVQELEKVTMPPRHTRTSYLITPKYNKLENTNCVKDRISEIKKNGVSDGSGYTFLGEFDSYEDCIKTIDFDPFSEAVTYFGPNTGNFSKQCYKINDKLTQVTNQPGVTCGVRDPSTPAEKITRLTRSCDRGKKEILGNKTCNELSYLDEKTEQTKENINWRITGTVPPGWDCWDQESGRCISFECLNSNFPDLLCDYRNKWTEKDINPRPNYIY